ncbi:MAG: TonB-dependent receptor [Pseudomonadota bacterium]
MRKSTVCIAAALSCVAAEVRADLLEEIVVSATRRQAVTSDITYAIDVVTDDELQPLLTDALRASVGVFVQQTTPGQGAAIIRGQRGSSVLHTVDGFRLNNAIFRSAPTQYFALVPSVGIERIEVLRGSPTSLYGSDAVGGVVQVVTRTPSFDERGQRGSFEARYDSADLLRMIAGSYETGDDTLALGVYANHTQTGDRRIGGGSRVGPSRYEATTARATLSYTPNDTQAWLIDLQTGRQPETPRFDELVAGFEQSEPDSEEFLFAPNERHFARAQYRHDFSRTTWTLDLGWQQINDDRQTRDFGSNARRFEENRSNLAGITSRWSADIAGFSWVAGVEAYADSVSSRRREVDVDSGESTLLSPRFPSGSETLQYAVFANASRELGDTLRVSGGLRANRVDVDLAETTLTSASSFSVGDVSGDVGLVAYLTPRLQWTANLGYGFRAPNIFDLGTLGNRPGNRFNVPNASLDSETAWQIDTGFRLATGALRTEVVVYAIDYRDRITSVSTGQRTQDDRDIVQSVNAASSDMFGIEAGFDIKFGDSITLGGIINYAHGDQQAGALEEPADRIPPLNGRVFFGWDASERWLFSLQMDFAAAQNRLSGRDENDNRIDPNGTPGWVTVGAGLGVELSNGVDIELRADNLLDKRYRNHGSGIDAPGRNLSISLVKLWE